MKKRMIVVTLLMALFSGFNNASADEERGGMLNIIENLPDQIDGNCSYHAEAGIVLNKMTDDFVNKLNSNINNILASYNMDCLAGMLSIDGLPSWLFSGQIPSFCELAVGYLDSNGASLKQNITSPEGIENFNKTSEKINKRYLQQQSILNQLNKKKD